MYTNENVFQSTLPIQGETMKQLVIELCKEISIHSPYTGRDKGGSRAWQEQKYFNPLSLYRERRYVTVGGTIGMKFQSTLPIQGETLWRSRKESCRGISIHSPYTGRDGVWRCRRIFSGGISIHSPYTGRDRPSDTAASSPPFVFQSTLPIQGETKIVLKINRGGHISIHSPYTGRDWMTDVL